MIEAHLLELVSGFDEVLTWGIDGLMNQGGSGFKLESEKVDKTDVLRKKAVSMHGHNTDKTRSLFRMVVFVGSSVLYFVSICADQKDLPIPI